MEITAFLPVLLAEAQLSKDPGRKICAVAFDKKLNRLASGFNGLPRRVNDDALRYEAPFKTLFVVHAELNLIASAARLGISLQDSSVLLTEYQPCAVCAGALIQAGIAEIWYPKVPNSGEPPSSKWETSFHVAQLMLEEAGVKLRSF